MGNKGTTTGGWEQGKKCFSTNSFFISLYSLHSHTLSSLLSSCLTWWLQIHVMNNKLDTRISFMSLRNDDFGRKLGRREEREQKPPNATTIITFRLLSFMTVSFHILLLLPSFLTIAKKQRVITSRKQYWMRKSSLSHFPVITISNPNSCNRRSGRAIITGGGNDDCSFALAFSLLHLSFSFKSLFLFSISLSLSNL